MIIIMNSVLVYVHAPFNQLPSNYSTSLLIFIKQTKHNYSTRNTQQHNEYNKESFPDRAIRNCEAILEFI